jgi:tryptophan synthase beta chain
VRDSEALAAFRRVSELEGILPALEPSHALAWLMAHPAPGVHLVTLSGRGDKDLAEVLALLEASGAGTAGNEGEPDT